MKKSIIEKTVDTPAVLLERGIEESQQLKKNLPKVASQPIKKAKNYWYMLGPGLTTGASDDDPSGIATYSQTGARYGLGLLWMAAITFPLMAIVQEMCARIGLVTGRGLAGNIRQHFGRKVLYFSTILLFAANTFNIGADIGAMASGIRLIRPGFSFSLLAVVITLVILLLQIFTPYDRYAKYLKWLSLVLFAYIISAILTHPDWHTLFHYAFIPHIAFNKTEILLICAILGTTITPYLFFWQTSQEVEEEIAAGKSTLAARQVTNTKDVGSMRIDVWSGMFLSNIVMFFIIAACAATLFKHGITDINSAAQAAQALKPFAGQAASWLFTAGIIGVGLLAIPVMAGSSAYAITESIGKRQRQGLNSKLKQASTFYGAIIISMLIGLSLNYLGINPIKSLIYAAVLNGIVAPIIIVLIVILGSSSKVMGEWKNHKLSTGFGWLLVLIMSVSGIAAIISL